MNKVNHTIERYTANSLKIKRTYFTDPDVTYKTSTTSSVVLFSLAIRIYYEDLEDAIRDYKNRSEQPHTAKLSHEELVNMIQDSIVKLGEVPLNKFKDFAKDSHLEKWAFDKFGSVTLTTNAFSDYEKYRTRDWQMNIYASVELENKDLEQFKFDYGSAITVTKMETF